MPQEPTIGQTVRDWVQAHGYVDLGLQVVVLALFLLVALAATSGAAYWLWWLVRLCRAENVQDFTNKPIPGLRRGKVASMEWEVGELARSEGDAVRAIKATLEDMNFRLEEVEASVRKLAEFYERFEDVSGSA